MDADSRDSRSADASSTPSFVRNLDGQVAEAAAEAAAENTSAADISDDVSDAAVAAFLGEPRAPVGPVVDKEADKLGSRTRPTSTRRVHSTIWTLARASSTSPPHGFRPEDFGERWPVVGAAALAEVDPAVLPPPAPAHFAGAAAVDESDSSSLRLGSGSSPS